MQTRSARLHIDLDSPVPAYRQIVDGVRTLLVEGRLRPGDALPPVRQLAADLGVHFNTVAEAYRQLSAEGWLELRRRLGARVCERSAPAASDSSAAAFRRRLRELVAEARAQGVSPARLMRELQSLADGLRS